MTTYSSFNTIYKRYTRQSRTQLIHTNHFMHIDSMTPPHKPGYHITEIPKGTAGSSSKLLEEVLELIDAEKQGSKIMALIELSDLIGAIELYLEKNVPSIALADLEQFSTITRRAFQNGHRT